MPDSAADHRRWPQARHLAVATLAWSFFVAYGSLTPFHFRPLEWSQAGRMLWMAVQQPLQPASRGDWITNFLLLTPWGFVALGALLVDRDRPLRRGAGIGIVLAIGFMLSIAVEAAQIWFPPRIPSKSDVVAQTLGNVVGMGLWILAGQTLTDWTRRQLHGPRAGRVVWLLGIYAAGLAFYSLLPLDLTLRLRDLWDKYQGGKVEFIPFHRWQWDTASLYGAIRDISVFLPVGMLAAMWPARAGQSDRRIARRWLAGVALVGLIEFLQLFVRSRHSDVTDLILGTIGVSGGLWIALNWNRASAANGRIAVMLRAACLVGFVLLLTAVFLEPFEMTTDHGAAQQRLAAMFRVPLEALRQGDLLSMVSNMLRKVLLFGVLGWLVRQQVTGSIARGALWPIAWGLLAGLTTAAVIEVAQAWFPAHTPDVTDIVWGAVGGGLGAYVGQFANSGP